MPIEIICSIAALIIGIPVAIWLDARARKRKAGIHSKRTAP